MDAIMVSANEETESLSQLRTLHHLVAVRGNILSNNLNYRYTKNNIKSHIVSYDMLFFYQPIPTALQDSQMLIVAEFFTQSKPYG